jgi:hypothetical protein
MTEILVEFSVGDAPELPRCRSTPSSTERSVQVAKSADLKRYQKFDWSLYRSARPHPSVPSTSVTDVRLGAEVLW